MNKIKYCVLTVLAAMCCSAVQCDTNVTHLQFKVLNVEGRALISDDGDGVATYVLYPKEPERTQLVPEYSVKTTYVTNKVSIEAFYYFYNQVVVQKIKTDIPWSLPRIKHDGNYAYDWHVLHPKSKYKPTPGRVTTQEFFVVIRKENYFVRFEDTEHLELGTVYSVTKKFIRNMSNRRVGVDGRVEVWEIPVGILTSQHK